MLKHVVMYRLKQEHKQEKQKLIDTFLSMKGKIPVLKGIESGGDILNTSRSFDVVLICDFESHADLEEYSEHPVHQKVREFVRGITEVSHSVDFIY